MTDGTEFLTCSTYGRPANAQPRHRPEHAPGLDRRLAQLIDRGGRLSRFNSRFAGLSFGKK